MGGEDEGLLLSHFGHTLLEVLMEIFNRQLDVSVKSQKDLRVGVTEVRNSSSRRWWKP